MKRIIIAVCVLALAACSSANTDTPDNISALQDIQQHRTAQEVTVEGTVAQVNGDSGGPTGMHENFLIDVSSGSGDEQLIRVAHNIDIAPKAPLKVGDEVIVRGELELDRSGPIIHFTHHDPRGRHQAGFVKVNGQTYD